MSLWTDYETKEVPTDEDDLMIYDKAGKANKRLFFTSIWNWIVGKFGTGNVSALKTTDKTITGSINELQHGKTNGVGITFSVNEDGKLRVTYDDSQGK